MMFGLDHGLLNIILVGLFAQNKDLLYTALIIQMW
jgi:hypothetical protein